MYSKSLHKIFADLYYESTVQSGLIVAFCARQLQEEKTRVEKDKTSP